MITFKEYIEKRLMEDDSVAGAPNVSNQIIAAGNDIVKKNPKMVPGLSDPKDIKNGLQGNAAVAKLVANDPKAAGAVGAYLGGPDAAKKLAGI